MKKLLLILFTLPFLQGCAVALVGAGVGAVKSANAKKKNAQVLEQEKYGQYRIEMEKLNFEREKAGLQTKDILTFEQWAGKEREDPAPKKEVEWDKYQRLSQ